jgi:hypothetical protein
VRLFSFLLLLGCAGHSRAATDIRADRQMPLHSALYSVLVVLNHHLGLENDGNLVDRCSILRATGTDDQALDSLLRSVAPYRPVDSAITASPCQSVQDVGWDRSAKWAMDSVGIDSTVALPWRSRVYATFLVGSVQFRADYELIDQGTGLFITMKREYRWMVQ